jgi:SLT domain-containing protein
MNAENALFKNKSEKQRAAAQLSIGLLDKEKRENAKKIMSDAYAAAMSAYKSLAPIPFVGPALGAAAAAAILGTGAQYAAQSLAGRALGGQVRAGESYMVGERGPEVLTMGNGGGSITPNEAIRNEKSQVVNKTANVSFNIQANDTQGFDELLVQRRGLIINVINEALNDQGKAAIA